MNLERKYKKTQTFWGLYAWGAWGCTPLTTKSEKEGKGCGVLAGCWWRRIVKDGDMAWVKSSVGLGLERGGFWGERGGEK